MDRRKLELGRDVAGVGSWVGKEEGGGRPVGVRSSFEKDHRDSGGTGDGRVAGRAGGLDLQDRLEFLQGDCKVKYH